MKKLRLYLAAVALYCIAGILGVSFLNALVNELTIDVTETGPGHFFLGLLWFLLVGIVFAAGRQTWETANELLTDQEVKAEALRSAEKEDRQAEKERLLTEWNKYYRAFQTGAASEYPSIDASCAPFSFKPNEVCYAFTSHAILGRGAMHELEISTQADSRFEIRGITLGRSRAIRDSYSSIQYDENQPGKLVITNRRIMFISAPTAFMDFEPERVLSVAWDERYVLLLTNFSADQSANILAFHIVGNEFPSWVFAGAIFRATVDSVADRA